MQRIPETAHFETILTTLLPFALWCIWWLLCVNWTKLWPVLGRGAWAAVVLFVLMAGSIWGWLDPVECHIFGIIVSPLAWHLGSAIILLAVALFCGWLQGLIHWNPPDFPVQPTLATHDHGHSHH